ncbi:M14 family zinc carboxypeptidase [Candidatus Lokiarchaeum ossiferum]
MCNSNRSYISNVYTFFHEQFSKYRCVPLILPDYLFSVNQHIIKYHFFMTFLIISLSSPSFLSLNLSSSTFSTIPLTAHLHQAADYEYIWDEFSDAPGDIAGDDILQFGPSFGKFHNYTEIIEKLTDLESSFPNYCEVFTIGKTHLNHEIYGIKLTDKMSVNSKEEILIVAQHHAREQITVENALYFMDRLIFDAQQQDFDALHTLSSREIYIIPSLNIDGAMLISINPWQRKTTSGMNLPKDVYEFSNLELTDLNNNGYIEAYYTKTDQIEGSITGYEGIDMNNDSIVGDIVMKGTDPNRNYNYGFGDLSFSSKDQNSFIYSGEYAFSEDCTKNLKNFISKHSFKTAVSLHSGIQAIYYPYIKNQKGKEKFDLSNYFNVTRSLEIKLGFHSGAMRNPAGLFAPWMYWKHSENRLAYCLETYGNESAYRSSFNESTGIYSDTGIWDFFNPAADKVIDNSALIYRGLFFLANYDNPEPERKSPILYIILGGFACLSIGLFVMRKKGLFRRNLTV